MSTMTLAWILVALAIVLLVMGLLRILRARKDAAFLDRLEAECWQRYTEQKYPPTLTDEEVEEFHRTRWD